MNKIFSTTHKQINWSAIILFSLGFWISASLVLDFILIPSLSVSGMMAGTDFASAGFLISEAATLSPARPWRRLLPPIPATPARRRPSKRPLHD